MKFREGLWLRKFDSLLGLVLDGVVPWNTRGRQVHPVTDGFGARRGRVSTALAVT